MTTCDDILEALVLGDPLGGDATRHVAACAACGARAPLTRTLVRALATDQVPEAPPSLSTRVLRAAAPLLEHNARLAAWRPLAWAIAAALLPLPAILLVDAYMLRTIYGLLSAILPAQLSFYLVANYAGVLALLLALTYGAIPLLAERQARLHRTVIHA